MISQLVTFLATCRAVTLARVDIDAKAITHNGNKLCGSKMEAKMETKMEAKDQLDDFKKTVNKPFDALVFLFQKLASQVPLLFFRDLKRKLVVVTSSLPFQTWQYPVSTIYSLLSQ